MFIDLPLNKETSSIRSDMFLFMPLLTELPCDQCGILINRARLQRFKRMTDTLYAGKTLNGLAFEA